MTGVVLTLVLKRLSCIQRPPAQRDGFYVEQCHTLTQTVESALLADLQALEGREELQDHLVFDTVIGHIAPLPVLRQVVSRWRDSLPSSSALYDAAESIALVLCPECVADEARPSPGRQAPLLPDVPSWKALAGLPRVLSGPSSLFRIPEPPSSALGYPFADPVTLKTASSTAD